MKTTEIKKLVSADYYINYYGKQIDIKDNKKILCLFVGGSMFGDGGADRYWSSSFELYVANEKDFGKTLIMVGEASEGGNGYSVGCSFTINGVKHNFDGLSADQFFNTIMKR